MRCGVGQFKRTQREHVYGLALVHRNAAVFLTTEQCGSQSRCQHMRASAGSKWVIAPRVRAGLSHVTDMNMISLIIVVPNLATGTGLSGMLPKSSAWK